MDEGGARGLRVTGRRQYGAVSSLRAAASFGELHSSCQRRSMGLALPKTKKLGITDE